MGNIYLQIGAGAGDLDARALYRDGFTEIVKKVVQPDDRVILVEPNPLNIAVLKRSWNSFKQAEIYEVGIVPKSVSGSDLSFYFSELDAPHYQVGSFDSQHVLKHYPQLKHNDLKCLMVETIDLLGFLSSIVGGRKVELLSLDIEGLDAEVILDTDFSAIQARLLSVEHLHLGVQADEVISHLEKGGFVRRGLGVDHNGYDWLFEKLV
jgi:hypothetical protein